MGTFIYYFIFKIHMRDEKLTRDSVSRIRRDMICAHIKEELFVNEIKIGSAK